MDDIPSTPANQAKKTDGGYAVPIKPMDKPANQYLANETVPEDSFCAEAPPGELENPGDMSKRFVR